MAALRELFRFQHKGVIDEDKWREILDLLVCKGWELREGDRRALVPISDRAIVHCFDGRPVVNTDPDFLKGIRIPGGVYGIAALSRKVRRSHGNSFFQACRVAEEAGYIPSAHGGPHGCGFVNLWLDGQFDGLHEVPVLPENTREYSTHHPPFLYLTLAGEHHEQEMEIIIRDGMTRIPDGKAFQLTAWAGPSLGIDACNLVFAAMDTIDRLEGPQKAVIYR